MAEPIQGTYVCGDKSCATFLGESAENCPQDCLPSGGGAEGATPSIIDSLAIHINPWLLLAGILMMLTLVIPLIYWRRKEKTPWRFFAWGALIWTINIIIKATLDFTFNNTVFAAVGGITFFYALYFGIRTGVFESGLSYLFIRLKKRMKEANWGEAVAFGIGFGGLENFILGLQSFLTAVVLLAAPEVLQRFPSSLQAEYLKAYTASSWIIFAPALERIAALFAHILASVLLFAAVKTGKMRYFWYSFLYKMIIDGSVLYLTKISVSSFLTSVYLVEIPIIIYGLVGFWGLKRLRKIYS
ncbi:MAG: YhfC family glutamic-type intramembrane protease [Candidatus Doudnabacteria bacterium]